MASNTHYRALLCLACVAMPSLACARLWRVPDDAATIQAGIDLAVTGDIVEIACGTYLEHGITLKSDVTVRSESGSHECVVIDAQGQGRVIICDDVAAATAVEDLTITGGLGAGDYPDCLGGGIYCRNASPVFRGCLIVANTADYGGGLYCRDSSSPALIDCLLIDNESRSEGGAVMCFNASSPQLEGCTLAGNVADAAGGALHCASGSTPSLTACTLAANTAPSGSALSGFDASPITLTGCLICFGTGGAAFVGDSGSVPVLTCSDIFGNEGGDWTGPLAAQLGGAGNISVAPQFCAAEPQAGANWTLQIDSPCAEANSACGLIGAWNVGCGETLTQRATWGQLKQRYR